LYRRICLVKGEAWPPEKQEKWRQEIVNSYGGGADEELFCIPARAGIRYFPSTLLDAVSDSGAAVICKACEDSFTFEKEEKRVREFDKWFKREVWNILLTHANPVYIGEDFARSGDLTCIFLDEETPDGWKYTGRDGG
jgi:phage FluMu gp28-like protein